MITEIHEGAYLVLEIGKPIMLTYSHQLPYDEDKDEGLTGYVIRGQLMGSEYLILGADYSVGKVMVINEEEMKQDTMPFFHSIMVWDMQELDGYIVLERLRPVDIRFAMGDTR